MSKMPNDNEKNTIPQNKPTIHATQLPIDLASKVIVKPANDNSKMIQQPTFRTIQQPAQMRVVRMPGTPGATQIIQTHIVPQTILKTPAQQTGRSTITVSKSPATYLPRVTATLSTIPQNKPGAQQIRTPTPPVLGTAMSPAFVRSITPRTSSPTAVLSQGGTTAWVAGGNTMQVQVPTQLIRSTNTPNRTHILQPSTVTVNNAGNAQTITNIFGQQSGQQQNITGSTTISVPATSSGGGSQQQPTYVATVLPQRPATIVYTSQQQQPFTAIQGQVQRMGISNPTTNTRQVRPIQRIPTTGIRVNTSSLSIRPNVPGLTPTAVLNRNTTTNLVPGTNTTISNTIPARIYQVATSMSQSQSGVSGSQQVIGQQNQKILQANVMTLPIIVNNRITQTVKTPLQPGIIAHVSKITPGSVSSDGTILSNSITTTIPSNTMVASIQAGQQSNQLQVSQGSNQATSYTTQPTQVANLTNQSGSQIITVSQQQQQQIIQGTQSNIHQQNSNVSTVVPLQISARGGNIPIKTITVSTASSGNLDASNIHRNLSSNSGNMQATTIMPIAKIVQSQQQQNLTPSSNQSTSVFIQTRIPSSTISATNPSQVVSVSSTPTSTIFSSAGQTVFYEQASVSIAPSSSSIGNIETKTTSSSAPSSESYTVVSAPNIRYQDKMIHSIIANQFNQSNQSGNVVQQGSTGNISQQSHPQTVRYSPLIVESQNTPSQGNTSHQIITMPGNLVSQPALSLPQQQQIQNSSLESSVITALSASPRSVGTIRKQNETTPIKIPKKAAKPTTSAKQQQQQQQEHVKQIPVASSSSPKGLILPERESSPAQGDGDWSDDGSTTVSIPNSPSPEEDDLDAMIMSNQFNRKSQDETDFTKFIKSVAKLGSAVKRELSDAAMTPKKKIKISNERVSTDVVDKAVTPLEIPESTENIVVKKREVVLKKPQASLLTAYNQSWKPAPNHFMRHSDVRVRNDDRRANVMDLANQPKVSQRIGGWKTHLISAEIDEVINDETHEMEILTNVLKRLEAKEHGPEAEKINELIKGNMQRSRLIVDSFNDSKTQLLKIFEHKEHALDIVNRCVSKRNFKKR